MIYVATLPCGKRYYAARQLTPQELANEACEHYGIYGCFAVQTARLAVRKGSLVEVDQLPVIENRLLPETCDQQCDRLMNTYRNKFGAAVTACRREHLDRLEAWLKAGGG